MKFHTKIRFRNIRVFLCVERPWKYLPHLKTQRNYRSKGQAAVSSLKMGGFTKKWIGIDYRYNIADLADFNCK